MVKNEFYKRVEEAELRGASVDELREILGRGRAKLGIFEGDIFEGEIEIGQAASLIHRLQSVNEVMKELIEDYNEALNRMQANQQMQLWSIRNELQKICVVLYIEHRDAETRRNK